MAYYECLSNNNDHIINIGDKINVSLTGSHNLTTIATVCFINETTVCLLGDTSLGNTNNNTACTYAWNYTININNKNYIGLCIIPTLEKIYSKCAGYKRDFSYWTSTKYAANNAPWVIENSGRVFVNSPSLNYENLPFIEITL